MLALTPPPDRAIPVLWQNFIRTFNVPGRQGWRNDSRGGGLDLGGPMKRVRKCLKGPKSTYTTIAIAEKQSKRSKKVPFSLYIGPPGPTQEMELMEPGGEGPSRSPPPGFSTHAGRLDTVPSAHSRSLASVRFLPQTRTPLRVGAKCGRPHWGSNQALTTGISV